MNSNDRFILPVVLGLLVVAVSAAFLVPITVNPGGGAAVPWVEIPEGVGNGVILAQAGRFGESNL
jgi:hypothetical protein